MADKKVSILDEAMKETWTPQKQFDFMLNYENNDAKVESELRWDVNEVIKHYSDTFFKNWISNVMDYSMSWIQRRLAQLHQGKTEFSNMKQPIVKTFVDRIIKWIYRTNFSLNMLSIKDNKTWTKTLQHIAEWFYWASKMKYALQDAAKSATLNGNGYVKLIFNTPQETKQYLKQLSYWSAEPIEITSKPVSIEWVSEFDLFFDPSEPLNWDQTFVIYRWIKSLTNVLENVVKKLDEYVWWDQLSFVVNNPKPFDPNNYNTIRNIIYYEDYYLKSCTDKKDLDVNWFIKLAKWNKKVEYIEIWERDVIYILINGWLVWQRKNPLYWKKYRHPFFAIYMDKIPWTWIWIWMWTSMRNLQRSYDSLFNLLYDNAKMCANPMIQVEAWAFDPDFVWQWGKVTESKINFLTPPPLNAEVINAMQNQLELASMMVTPASYWDYQTQSRSATDANIRQQTLNDSIIMLADSITEMLNMCFESLLEQMKDKMPDEFLLPISKEDKKVRAKISKEDIITNAIYEWVSDSIQEADKMAARQQLPEFLNSLINVAVDWTWRSAINNEELVKYIVELWDLPEWVVKSKWDFYNDMKDSQIKQAEIQNEVAVVQQEWQQAAQEQMAQDQQIQENLWEWASQSDINFAKSMMM